MFSSEETTAEISVKWETGDCFSLFYAGDFITTGVTNQLVVTVQNDGVCNGPQRNNIHTISFQLLGIGLVTRLHSLLWGLEQAQWQGWPFPFRIIPFTFSQLDFPFVWNSKTLVDVKFNQFVLSLEKGNGVVKMNELLEMFISSVKSGIKRLHEGYSGNC